jgi:hypothetical protein
MRHKPGSKNIDRRSPLSFVTSEALASMVLLLLIGAFAGHTDCAFIATETHL